MEEKVIHNEGDVGEKKLDRAVKKGMRAPHIKVLARLLLATLIIASIAIFASGIIRYNELQREKQALEQKVEEYEAEVEELEYFLNSPMDYDYVVRLAKKKLNLYLPDEIIYHSDSDTNE